jgi:hypothetical protein
VPYLATSVWLADTKMDPPLPSLRRSGIQKDKLDIYGQELISLISVSAEKFFA